MWNYRPVAFTSVPRYAREALLLVGLCSLIMTVVVIVYSFFAFTPAGKVTKFIKIFYDCIAVKAVCWAPFLALEYYDLFFENIYYDVQFQLNPIKPINPGKTSRRVVVADDESQGSYLTKLNPSVPIEPKITEVAEAHEDEELDPEFED